MARQGASSRPESSRLWPGAERNKWRGRARPGRAALGGSKQATRPVEIPSGRQLLLRTPWNERSAPSVDSDGSRSIHVVVVDFVVGAGAAVVVVVVDVSAAKLLPFLIVRVAVSNLYPGSSRRLSTSSSAAALQAASLAFS